MIIPYSYASTIYSSNPNVCQIHAFEIKDGQMHQLDIPEGDYVKPFTGCDAPEWYNPAPPKVTFKPYEFTVSYDFAQNIVVDIEAIAKACGKEWTDKANPYTILYTNPGVRSETLILVFGCLTIL